MILIEVVIVALMAYRVWRLLALDELTRPLRERSIDQGPGWVASLWYCSWCLGTWVTVAVGLATYLTGLTDSSPWLVIPAAATLVGLTARLD